ncbi:MAG: phosphoribosylanthranilate isomerase [Lachnospiraceae bacterium]|nr:phosphoribosylanthranilate isomerase [Lachnospiraceae bacterium]
MMIKICGITTPAEAELLNRLGPDIAGMVLFFPKSKRNVSIENAKVIMGSFSKEIKKAAVMVSPTFEQASEAIEAGFDILQIHGEVDEKILKETDIPIFKAFNIRDLDQWERYHREERISGYVMDAAEPGSGKPYDRSILEKIPRDDRIFMLAGGLDPENVAEAVREVSPDGVDVSSGVEYDDRKGKDPEKLKRFFETVRGR